VNGIVGSKEVAGSWSALGKRTGSPVGRDSSGLTERSSPGNKILLFWIQGETLERNKSGTLLTIAFPLVQRREAAADTLEDVRKLIRKQIDDCSFIKVSLE
jgi:hypothetical protein